MPHSTARGVPSPTAAWIGSRLAAEEVVVGFAGADGFESVGVDEDFRGAGAGVVLAGHYEAVGAGGKDGQQIAALYRREVAVLGEEVAAFAYRAVR